MNNTCTISEVIRELCGLTKETPSEEELSRVVSLAIKAIKTQDHHIQCLHTDLDEIGALLTKVSNNWE